MKVCAGLMGLIWLSPLLANDSFRTGPVFSDFGRHVKVKEMAELDKNAKFSVVFDVAKAAQPGELNQQFESLARFINMHVASGIAKENIQLALVVHGKAGFDLVDKKNHQRGESIELVKALLANDVKVYLCGQSAAYHGIAASDLIDGVEMSLSAMTAHAMLAKQGYSLNPF